MACWIIEARCRIPWHPLAPPTYIPRAFPAHTELLRLHHVLGLLAACGSFGSFGSFGDSCVCSLKRMPGILLGILAPGAVSLRLLGLGVHYARNGSPQARGFCQTSLDQPKTKPPWSKISTTSSPLGASFATRRIWRLQCDALELWPHII